MYSSITITIDDGPDVDRVHRFRNLGEDIWRALHKTCEISLSEIDAASRSFTVSRIRWRQLRGVAELITNELRRHGLETSAHVSVVRAECP